MSKKQITNLAIIGVSTLILPPVLVVIFNQGALSFDPQKFVNEWFKLLISLVSLFVSFMLGQVYWENTQAKKKRKVIYNSLLTFLSRLYTIATDSRALASREFTSEKYEEIDLIDKRLLENFRRLDTLKNSYFYLFSDVEVHRLSDMLDIYLYEIAPTIGKLALYQNIQNIQGDIPTIRELLVNLEINCINAIDILNNNLEGNQ